MKLFRNSKYQDRIVKTYLKDIIIIIISATAAFSALTATAAPDFYIPFPSSDFKALKGSMISDCIKTGVSEYIYHVSVGEIISKRIITVYTDNKIRIISKGEKLLWGDSLTAGNLVKIKGGLYKGNILSVKRNKKRFFRIRKYIRDHIEEKIKDTGSENGLTLALITGSRNDLLREDVLKFRRSGCSHLLALSGMHLGIISLFFYFLIKPVFGIRTALPVINIINLFYLFISGFSPSLIRACILTAVLSFSKITDNKIPMHRALFLTFLINIVITPGNMQSLSFQYSYLALAGIVLFAGPLYRMLLSLLPVFLSAPLACSLSAQLFTSLLSAYVFGEVFPSGILASIAVTPLITLFMWSSLMPLLIPSSALFSPLILLFRSINNLVSEIIIEAVSFFSKFPHMTFSRLSFIVLIIFNLSVMIIFTVPDPGLKYFKRYR